jgi:hypothetical protein
MDAFVTRLSLYGIDEMLHSDTKLERGFVVGMAYLLNRMTAHIDVESLTKHATSNSNLQFSTYRMSAVYLCNAERSTSNTQMLDDILHFLSLDRVALLKYTQNGKKPFLDEFNDTSLVAYCVHKCTARAVLDTMLAYDHSTNKTD